MNKIILTFLLLFLFIQPLMAEPVYFSTLKSGTIVCINKKDLRHFKNPTLSDSELFARYLCMPTSHDHKMRVIKVQGEYARIILEVCAAHWWAFLDDVKRF